MTKDLTTSRLDRQNILNNEIAIKEIEETANVDVVFFKDNLYVTKEMAAEFFQVDVVPLRGTSAHIQTN